MTRESEVLEHYNARVFEDAESMLLEEDTLREIAEYLPDTRHFVSDIFAGDLRSTVRDFASKTAPLLSTAFLKYTLESFETDGIPPGRICQLIGQKLLPMTGIEVEGRAIRADCEVNNAGACMDAEPYFVDLVRQIEGDIDENTQPYADIFYTAAGHVALLGKRVEWSSALTLAPMNIRGMVVPPFTIVGVPSVLRRDAIAKNTYTDVGRRIEAYQLPPYIGVFPLRLSPWAYSDPMDQLLFAVHKYELDSPAGYDAERAQTIEALTPERIRAAAISGGELCGLELSAFPSPEPAPPARAKSRNILKSEDIR